MHPEGVEFCVWAPDRRQVDVVIEGTQTPFPLVRDRSGTFRGLAPGVRAGQDYRYRLDGKELYPDPCSRWQPHGPHGASRIVDPRSFPWTDKSWRGVELAGQILYELHIGTFTAEGTFDAAARQLPELKRLGITLVEVMPIHEWAGERNWGYDGVDLYAPEHAYGSPDSFKRFVNTAHRLGLGVVLDVVYNHLGPDGCYLKQFSKSYFSEKYKTGWGEALNFDGPGSAGTREFFIQNACYWVNEFHVDGLRLDATQKIFDQGKRHVLGELSSAARQAAGSRTIVLMAEDEDQNRLSCLPVSQGGYGMDAVWSDDFHHSVRVALTGQHEGFLDCYRGTAQELVSALKYGYLYQGQYDICKKTQRGSSVISQPPASFVFYLQNHDQIANYPTGERLTALTSPARFRALTAFLLLSPHTPLLFMGQEFGASSPFTYFVDHHEDLAPLIRKGRESFFAQFPSARGKNHIADPSAIATFQRCKLRFAERKKHAAIYGLHKDLIRLRRNDPVISGGARVETDGAVLGPLTFTIRLFGPSGDDRLLMVNLGSSFNLRPCAEPLLAPPPDRCWSALWSSQDRRYGGKGGKNPDGTEEWVLPAESALFYRASFCRKR